MSNLLAQPSFEDVTPWTLVDTAVQWAASARTGSFGVLLSASTFPFLHSPFVTQDVGVSIGIPHTASVRVRHDAGAGMIELGVYEGGAFTSLATITSDAPDGSWELLTASHTPAQSPSTFSVQATGAAIWDIDDAVYGPQTTGADMAVTLAERPVRETLWTIQTYLAAELAKVEACRADGITLPFPDRWFDYEHPEVICDRVQCEVFETDLAFTQPETDYMMQGQQSTTAASITIRLTHRNFEQSSPSAMAQRSRRYQVAIRNVIADHPGLYTGVTALYVVPESMSTHVGPEFDAERQRVRDRVSFRMTLNQYENRDGETTPGGAALPALPIAVS